MGGGGLSVLEIDCDRESKIYKMTKCVQQKIHIWYCLEIRSSVI